MAIWKERALKYVDAGDMFNAFMSMASDLPKSNSTFNVQDQCDIRWGIMLLDAGELNDPDKMRNYINGFN